jgi:RND family efflux transporter MFP subunit
MHACRLKSVRVGLLLTTGAALIILAGCSNEAPRAADPLDIARPAKIATVGGTTSAARTFPGRVQAAQQVPLAFRVGGPVISIDVSKGESVAAGDVLARIDPRDYEVQVKNLQARLAASRAQEIQARETYRRVRGLFENDNASKADFDNARAALDVATAQLEATSQALEAARLSLDDTRLRAPYAGTVADRLVEAHETVAPGRPVVLFQDVRGLEVVIDVPEREVSGLTSRDSASIMVRFDAVAGEQAFPATIKEFATESDPQTRTFPVTLQLSGQPNVDLLPGMTASVRWGGATDSLDNTLVVPVGSIVGEETGTTFVWSVDPDTDRVLRTPVATGGLNDCGILILDGLNPGDRILVAGVHFVQEGQLVRALDARPSGN